MAELLQLDAAAAQIGKSEVTLRRLIKAGKIPFQKEKTLTGFIYLVDPEAVQNYYQGRDAEILNSEEFQAAETGDQEVSNKEAKTVHATPYKSAVRVAVASETGSAVEYWQKRAEIYEDRYTQEMQKHSQAREELGMWRGRAEQAQTMLTKLLPASSEEVPKPVEVVPVNKEASPWLVSILVTLVFLIIIAGAVVIYLKLY